MQKIIYCGKTAHLLTACATNSINNAGEPFILTNVKGKDLAYLKSTFPTFVVIVSIEV